MAAETRGRVVRGDQGQGPFPQALVFRHEQKFDEFRKAMQAALDEAENVKKDDVKKGRDLASEFARVREEMSNSTAYFMPRVKGCRSWAGCPPP